MVKFKCKNCGTEFLEDVKIYSDHIYAECPYCKSTYHEEIGPGLPYNYIKNDNCQQEKENMSNNVLAEKIADKLVNQACLLNISYGSPYFNSVDELKGALEEILNEINPNLSNIIRIPGNEFYEKL